MRYEDQIQQLIEEVAGQSRDISEELKSQERKELSDYRKIRAKVNSLSVNLEQLIRFIDLSEEDEAE